MSVLRIEPGSSASVLAESALQLRLSIFSKQREIKRTDFEVRITGGSNSHEPKEPDTNKGRPVPHSKA